MNRRIVAIISSLITACVIYAGSAQAAAPVWTPDSGDPVQASAAKAIERFKTRYPEIQRYFDEAYAYAVYPGAVRGGFGVGLGYGSGVVIEQGRMVARSRLWQFTYAVLAGAQWYGQILFFKDKAAFDEFKGGTLEFIGQAAVALLHLGAAADPSFSKGVALATQTRLGLEIELTPGMVYFSYRPVKPPEPAVETSRLINPGKISADL